MRRRNGELICGRRDLKHTWENISIIGRRRWGFDYKVMIMILIMAAIEKGTSSGRIRSRWRRRRRATHIELVKEWISHGSCTKWISKAAVLMLLRCWLLFQLIQITHGWVKLPLGWWKTKRVFNFAAISGTTGAASHNISQISLVILHFQTPNKLLHITNSTNPRRHYSEESLLKFKHKKAHRKKTGSKRAFFFSKTNKNWFRAEGLKKKRERKERKSLTLNTNYIADSSVLHKPTRERERGGKKKRRLIVN